MHTYSITVRHAGLNKIRVITGRDAHVVEEKARLQAASWDEMWERRWEKEQRNIDAQNRREALEQAKQLAAKQTAEAKKAVEECEQILAVGLAGYTPIDWEGLKSHANFDKARPTATPAIPTPMEPSEGDFAPKIGFWASLFGSVRRRIEKEARDRYDASHSAWKAECEDIRQRNEANAATYASQAEEWGKERSAFEMAQRQANDAIDDERRNHKANEPHAIVNYCDRVLDNSDYPDFFPRDWTVSFDPTNRTLVVDYWLPTLDDVPDIKEVKYIVSRDAFDEVRLKDSAVKKLYDDVVYQTCLRTMFELYSV